MKNGFIVFFLALTAICTIILFSTGGTKAEKEYSGISGSFALTSEHCSNALSDDTVYILREFNGMLAVFREYSDIPAEVFGIMVKTLPEIDRELLKSGIILYGEKNMRRAVEDYTG